MYEFEKRRDRYEFFESFESPLLNITFPLELPDFLSFCKTKSLPPFHFFLFCLMRSLEKVEAFRYRHLDGKVFRIDEYFASYTVMNADRSLNYTRFANTPDLKEFIKRSLEAKVIAEGSEKLMNTGIELTPREMKNYVFITSIPWLDFSSIQHPVYRFKSADIPSIAWGKFVKTADGIRVSFSIQAHHGFVDGYHIHELGEALKKTISEQLTT
jgi:chloramphenicol O-acetyltransferase type A